MCESFIMEGETKSESYIFCSFVPEEVKYSYRVGKWTFSSSYGYKIGEGEYDTLVKIREGHGGCPYSFVENSIDLSKWKFWNQDGEVIKPTQKMINLIQSNQVNSNNPFLNY